MDSTRIAFDGKVAVVTGASRGIGKATITALANHGCRVAAVARPSTDLEHTVADLVTQGYDAQKFECDLNDSAATERLIKRLIDHYGQIDILVNCAGVGKFGPLIALDYEQARAPVKVPLLAAILLSKGLLPVMLDRNNCCIVNITGPAAYFDLPYMAAYTASRSGLVSFTRALDEEVKQRGVRVKSVCPTWVDTEYIERNNTDGNWLPKVSKYFPTASAEQAADFVLRAIVGNRREYKPSLLLRACALSYRWFPKISVGAFKLLGLYQPEALTKSGINREGSTTWTNWEQSIALTPSTTVFPKNIEEVSAIVTDTRRYPSPVRAAGSRHSTTHCGVTDNGTLLIMRKMERIIEIDHNNKTVTVEAGALYIDVAKQLQQHGLQFYVNVEIGNLTMGSAATTGTKDASMPDENGQVCSYCVSIRMVMADGSIRTVSEQEPELLQAIRSSYGLLGVVVETTFKIKPIQAMAVRHKSYTLDQFERALPELRTKGESMMYYLYPFQDSLIVEFRRYLQQELKSSNRWLWPLRNLFWKTIAPALSHAATRYISNHRIRYGLIDGFYKIIQVVLGRILANDRTLASDQIIRYPEHKGFTKYTFSIWAFAEEDIMPTMRSYYKFCQDYYEEHGFRCDMLNVGYRIAKDQNPIFSYSYDQNVMTLDPVTTGGPGWDDFLRAYNQFCSDHNGVPLFNQSKWLTRQQVQKAFGDRIAVFWRYRTEMDPQNRLLNQYFSTLFAPDSEQNITN